MNSKEIAYFVLLSLSFFSFVGLVFDFSGSTFLLSFLIFVTLTLLLPHVETLALLFFCEVASIFCFLFFSADSYLLIWLGFELSSLPIFMMIFLWGKQKEKSQALTAYLLYSVMGASAFLFSLFFFSKSFFLKTISFSSFIFFILLTPFLIKLPSFFFHLWLIMAHVEAPTVGSVILASLLLKLGSVGFFFFSYFPTLLLFLSLVGLLYLSVYLSCLNNLKLLIAFSSVFSMSYFIFGIFLSSNKSESASFFIQFTHSLTSSLLFLMAGWVQNLGSSLNLLWISWQADSVSSFVFLYNSGTYVGLLFLAEFLIFGSNQSVFLFFFLMGVLGSLLYNLLTPIFLKKKNLFLEKQAKPFFGFWSVFFLNNIFLVCL